MEEFTPAARGGAGLGPAALATLDGRLAAATYLVGGSLTLADLAAFAAAHPAVSAAGFDPAGLPNLARWFDLVQHTADLGDAFPRVPLCPAVAPPLEAAFAALKVAQSGKGSVSGAGAGAGAGDSNAKGKGKGKGGGAAAPEAKAAPAAAAVAGEGADGHAAPPADEVAALRAAKKAEKARKQAEKKAKKGGGAEATPAKDPDVSLLDIRVGHILSAEQHPEADGLYVEQIDVGEDAPRTIVSGLRKFVALEAMQDRPCVVLCNLKPAKMRGILSSGMVLCASNAAHDAVEPLAPPPGAAPGTRVTCEGFPGEAETNLRKMDKVFKAVAPDLKTDSQGVAGFKGVPLATPQGACVAASLPGCEVR